MKLDELPNIGRTLAGRLADVGIADAETLVAIGSREAFAKLRRCEGDTCLSCLCALEGAIQGVRWHDLSSGTKEDLKQYFRAFQC